jgi:hypothetical protein
MYTITSFYFSNCKVPLEKVYVSRQIHARATLAPPLHCGRQRNLAYSSAIQGIAARAAEMVAEAPNLPLGKRKAVIFSDNTAAIQSATSQINFRPQSKALVKSRSQNQILETLDTQPL